MKLQLHFEIFLINFDVFLLSEMITLISKSIYLDFSKNSKPWMCLSGISDTVFETKHSFWYLSLVKGHTIFLTVSLPWMQSYVLQRQSFTILNFENFVVMINNKIWILQIERMAFALSFFKKRACTFGYAWYNKASL